MVAGLWKQRNMSVRSFTDGFDIQRVRHVAGLWLRCLKKKLLITLITKWATE